MESTKHMDAESMFELYGSDRWREISALYCIDGKEAIYRLSLTEKKTSTVAAYAKVVDLN